MFESFDRAVRCSAGRVFTTICIPLGSLKAVRLAGRRYQRFPVGHHWAIVVSSAASNARPEELAQAATAHDMRVP